MQLRSYLKEPPPCRLYILAQFEDLQKFFDMRKDLETRLGPADYASDTISAAGLPSPYGNLFRKSARIVSFQRPVGREEIVDIRKKLIQAEGKMMQDDFPSVELTAGYVTERSVIESSLAETEGHVYLYGGIYAGPVYLYENHSYRPVASASEFYSRKETVTVFNDLRLILTGGTV